MFPRVVKIEETANSETLVFSVHQNIQRILDGETTHQSYFPNPMGDLMTLEQIGSGRGHPEWVG